jgi:hypothetical protein
MSCVLASVRHTTLQHGAFDVVLLATNGNIIRCCHRVSLLIVACALHNGHSLCTVSGGCDSCTFLFTQKLFTDRHDEYCQCAGVAGGDKPSATP